MYEWLPWADWGGEEAPAGTYRVVVDRTANSAAIPNDGFGNDYIPSNSPSDTTFTNGNPNGSNADIITFT